MEENEAAKRAAAFLESTLGGGRTSEQGEGEEREGAKGGPRGWVPEGHPDFVAPGARTLYSGEVNINGCRPEIRYTMTSRETFDKMEEEFGATVITRGIFKQSEAPSVDGSTASVAPASTSHAQNHDERPLHLYVTADSQDKVDRACAKLKYLLERPSTTPSGLLMNKVYIPFAADADPNFGLPGKVIGPSGSFVKHIQTASGCKVHLRGRGSSYVEANSRSEAPEPLHLFITGPNEQQMQIAKNLADQLIANVKKKYDAFLLERRGPSSLHHASNHAPPHSSPSLGPASGASGPHQPHHQPGPHPNHPGPHSTANSLHHAPHASLGSPSSHAPHATSQTLSVPSSAPPQIPPLPTSSSPAPHAAHASPPRHLTPAATSSHGHYAPSSQPPQHLQHSHPHPHSGPAHPGAAQPPYNAHPPQQQGHTQGQQHYPSPADYQAMTNAAYGLAPWTPEAIAAYYAYYGMAVPPGTTPTAPTNNPAPTAPTNGASSSSLSLHPSPPPPPPSIAQGEDMEMDMDDDEEVIVNVRGKRIHDGSLDDDASLPSSAKKSKYEDNGAQNSHSSGTDQPFWASTAQNRTNVLVPSARPPPP